MDTPRSDEPQGIDPETGAPAPIERDPQEPPSGWDQPVGDPSDNSPDDDERERGTFERLADDLDAGRITTADTVKRLVRGLAAQERGDSDDDVRAAFYPGEQDEPEQ